MQILNKKLSKLLPIFICLSISLALLLPTTAFAAPEFIKIGLFYAASAKDSYKLTSTGGMTVYLANDSNAVHITTDETVSSVTVKKNTYFSTETANIYPTADEALNAASLLKAEGKDAYCAATGENYTVRIGTYQSYEEAESYAEILGTYPVWNTDSGTLILKGDDIWLALDDESRFLEVSPCSGNLMLNNTAYRGVMRFVRSKNNDMAAINILPFEEYLYSVVPKEVSPSWHEEALKAQAVAARTYALTNLNKFSEYGFNLDNTVTSQVYGGMSTEDPRTTAAVDATCGEAVLYDGKPASVVYCSSTGGKTANSEDVWSSAVPYLKSVSDEYQNPDEATKATWEVTYTKSELKEKLLSLGTDIGEIVSVEAEYTDYGYVRKLTIVGTNGKKEFLKDGIRALPGIYSTCFKVITNGETELNAISAQGTFSVNLSKTLSQISSSGIMPLGTALFAITAEGIEKISVNTQRADSFTFSGGGWGHGIGMSQWGAKGMADNGFTYKEILQHYFSGVQVEKY